MNLSDRDKNALEALSGSLKHLASRVPGLGEALVGWESYNNSKFVRNVNKVMSFLKDKIDNPQSLFSEKWLQTEDGKTFTRKVFDSAFDAQQEEKQEQFVNALINGIRDQDLLNIEKLKFVDMLRQLSLASLYILEEIHKMFEGRVNGPTPQIKRDEIVRQLGDKFKPYLIESALSEMKAIGLFSSVIEWRIGGDGKFTAARYFEETESVYTQYTVNFVKFITFEKKKKLGERNGSV